MDFVERNGKAFIKSFKKKAKKQNLSIFIISRLWYLFILFVILWFVIGVHIEFPNEKRNDLITAEIIMRWGETVTLQFVKTYLKHECLWNPEHPGYKLKYLREKAYADIGTEFNVSTQKSLSSLEVKLKIKNLRTTYVQQVHKILEKSNCNSIFEPSLIWFHEMDKCLKNLPSRHSYNVSRYFIIIWI